MTDEAHLLFLGTGSSLGIPVVGCSCHVCSSSSQLNKRLRPSALLETQGKRYLIDCGPDFRTQALTHHITSLDGVILTHSHHDHCAGIDELRIFTFQKGTLLPCFLSESTHQELAKRYDYIFVPDTTGKKYTTNFALNILPQDQEAIDFNGLKINYCTYEQGGMKVTGLRIGNLAFMTDIKDYNESIFDFLQGVETLVITALRFTPSPLHLTVDDAIEFSRRVSPRHTWLTHIAHELEHDAVNAYLPANIRLAYDGLRISFKSAKANS